jgi:hypothetical protein
VRIRRAQRTLRHIRTGRTPFFGQKTPFRSGTRLAPYAGIVVKKCAYYMSASAGVLRMDLRALDPTGPYRLIVDGDTDRHVEYFEDRTTALERWAEFDAAMRPDAPEWFPSIH